MEGVLWKWTNYWNGWQTRWFILDNGVLSYFKSQEEVSQGCKGSVKVSSCQINVNSLDLTRLDLVIPGQQHMYLKAPSPHDRQKWLVALGSAKACVETIPIDSSKIDLEDPNSLSHKKSELRLYCDLMMQQVHAVKSSVASKESIELEKIDEATSLLTSTCDTFIRTLEDIMRMANTPIASSLSELPILGITAKNGPVNKVSGTSGPKAQRQSFTKTSSQDSNR